MQRPQSVRDHEEVKLLHAREICEILSWEGKEELQRPTSALTWSGIVAGLCISFSLLAEGFFRHYLADFPGRFLIENIGYTFGFIIVILGRFQLFTENTISAVLPLLYEKGWTNLFLTARVWSLVFFANLTGTLIVALLITQTNMMGGNILAEINFLSEKAINRDALDVFVQAIPAGFLVAAITWMLPNARESKFWVIFLMTYLIAIGDFAHVIVGSAELFTLLLQSAITMQQSMIYLTMAALGNILGGTGLFTLMAYAQVKQEVEDEQ